MSQRASCHLEVGVMLSSETAACVTAAGVIHTVPINFSEVNLKWISGPGLYCTSTVNHSKNSLAHQRLFLDACKPSTNTDLSNHALMMLILNLSTRVHVWLRMCMSAHVDVAMHMRTCVNLCCVRVYRCACGCVVSA